MSMTFGPQPEENEYGEELGYSGDIVLNWEYWDCLCENYYIFPRSIPGCWRCGVQAEDRLCAREPDVQELRAATEDWEAYLAEQQLRYAQTLGKSEINRNI